MSMSPLSVDGCLCCSRRILDFSFEPTATGCVWLGDRLRPKRRPSWSALHIPLFSMPLSFTGRVCLASSFAARTCKHPFSEVSKDLFLLSKSKRRAVNEPQTKPCSTRSLSLSCSPTISQTIPDAGFNVQKIKVQIIQQQFTSFPFYLSTLRSFYVIRVIELPIVCNNNATSGHWVWSFFFNFSEVFS